MYNENFISFEQRGLLKELILDYDERLIMYLEDYKFNDDKSVLYNSIIELISNGMG
jgi:hypothetical protein